MQVDFRKELYLEMPMVISTMPSRFTSYEFFRKFRDLFPATYQNLIHFSDAPFPDQRVHQYIARQLRKFCEWLGQVPSSDLGGKSNNCALWKKTEANYAG